MNVKLLDLQAQYLPLRAEIRRAIDEVCDTQQLILGPHVEKFEKSLAEYCHTKHAIGVSSGTDALLCSLMALGIGPGDEVICPSFTFFATAGCIARTGAKPVFAEIDPATFNIDPDKITTKITKNTKAIMPVHLFGQMANMDAINAIAEPHGLKVIEDAAQAIGARRAGVRNAAERHQVDDVLTQAVLRAAERHRADKAPGKPADQHRPANDAETLTDAEFKERRSQLLSKAKPACSWGFAGCLSFYPTKNLGAFGDAGAICTNDDAFAETCRKLRVHGSGHTYYHEMVGGMFRLAAIQAAVLSVKLKYLDGWHEARRRHAAIYDEMFAGSKVIAPKIDPRNWSIYNQYVVRVPDRDRVKQTLAEKGIGTAIYYPLPLHLQTCFKDLGYKQGDLPETEKACREVLALPVYPELPEEQVKYVAEQVLAAVKG